MGCSVFKTGSVYNVTMGFSVLTLFSKTEDRCLSSLLNICLSEQSKCLVDEQPMQIRVCPFMVLNFVTKPCRHLNCDFRSIGLQLKGANTNVGTFCTHRWKMMIWWWSNCRQTNCKRVYDIKIFICFPLCRELYFERDLQGPFHKEVPYLQI